MGLHVGCAPIRPSPAGGGRWDAGSLDAPGGGYTALASGNGNACGLRTDGTITCWGVEEHEPPEPPQDKFTAVSYGPWSKWCGLRTDQTITCWDKATQWAPLDGAFTAVAAGADGTCGLRSDGTISCSHSGNDSPQGTYRAISAGGGHFCGLRTDQTITCWGQTPVTPPEGVTWAP